METIPNARSFDYDIKSLLAYPPPPPYNEVVMTISGLPGTKNSPDWCGLGNGTHFLDGVESMNQYDAHLWENKVIGHGYLKLSCYPLSAAPATKFSSQFKVGLFTGSSASTKTATGMLMTTTRTPAAPASIGDFCLNNHCTLHGVTFTWTKGTNWSKGNM